MPTLWPQQCPSSVYKTDEACDGIAASEGAPSDIVLGRHVADGSVKGRVKVVHKVSPTTPAAVRVQHQLGQICSLPYTQRIQFLGFTVNSVEMSISLPREKVTKISQACRAMLRQPFTTVQELSQMIGRLTATVQAVLPAPLCYRQLQWLKNEAFSDISLIFNKTRSGTRSSAGPAMVEVSFQRVEWKGSTSPGS